MPLEVPYPSKVILPVRRPAIIRRQRLIDALSRAVERRVALVSAPAGYGKTTLLLDFAQSSSDAVCWYALDERDRDMHTFLRYFLAAGQRQFPGFGAELAQALLDSGAIGVEQATDLLVRAAQGVGQPFIFVFDDFHFLDDAPSELKQTLEGWLYRLPPECHVVLSGRTQPQLAVLPLMSVRQEVDTIGATDFAFACEEVVQLFRDVLRKDVSLDDAQHLADVTEGWAAALVLMADRVQANRTYISLEQLRGSDTLFQYIALEQFDPLPAEIKEFLTGSAVVRNIEPAMVNELLGIADTEEKLTFLDRRNLFVMSDSEHKGRRRYHRLFRAFLVSHLRSQDPARFSELNLKAAALREQAQEWEEAVYHFIQAAAWERIVEVTERVGWRFFEEGRWDTLADWLEAVPAEELSQQPKLMLWKARILRFLNQLDRALALLSQTIVSFEARREWVSLAEALVTRGMCLRTTGKHQEAKEALSSAQSVLLKNDGPTLASMEVRKELGITLGMCGEFDEALRELRGVLDLYEAQGDARNTAEVSENIGNALMALGRLSEASGYLERARQRWLKLGNDERLIPTLNNLGMLYYLQGDYEHAQRVFQQGLEKAKPGAALRFEIYIEAALADIRRARGDFAAALELYKVALDRAIPVEDASIRIYILDAIGNTYRLLGDIAGGEPWAQRASAEAEERGGMLEAGLCKTSLGLVQRDRGELREAAASLEEAVKLLKRANARRELSTAYVHLSGVYFSLKRKRMALECLEMAANIVAELGYDHFLVVEATRNPLLIQYAAANKIADGYFGRLLKGMKAAPSAAKGAATEGPEHEAGATVYAFGFGHLRVEIGGREITDLEWRSEKSKEMFFFFLCNRRPLRKEEILTALWPDLSEEKTTSAFHSNMYRLRKALYQECIAKDSGRYILDPRVRFVFDLEEFQRALQEADALPKASGEAIALLEKALALYKGQFAPEFYSEWAETLRWQLEEQYTGLLATLAAAYNQAKEYKRSADLCQRILELDEYNEAAWYRLMSNYIQSGQLEAARYSYNRYVQTMSKDTGDDGVPDFDELCREIAQGRLRR